MGTWITTANQFTSFLSDRVGYKSGLALSRENMLELLDSRDPLASIVSNTSDEVVRIRTNHILDSFQILLHRLGVIDKPFVGHAPTLLDLEYMNKPQEQALFRDVLKYLGEVHFDKGKQSIFDGFDEDAYFIQVEQKYGVDALSISKKLVSLTKLSEEATPWDWFSARVVDWSSPIELRALFESESLDSMYGTFLDQRYINYLAQNVDKISTMHWRKFEALTAEYYEKQGYTVELGAGRNDGGVDVRVWAPNASHEEAPVTIVQCKRTKAKIDKVLVKSLWADVIDEQAKSGVIVTSSYFSPGAREVCKARKYPIREANRDTVISWLNDLKATGKGVYMGE
ncbi:restriction endonuclease [uncultured Vibrio sp.]|uniref:restriction endonuclease n=1 Tax=uncultured Vibrio sp. TaxID=114054 RepID=UPI0029C9AC99|nr:restriction endonuclease [uncultured Vibrio sp.]